MIEDSNTWPIGPHGHPDDPEVSDAASLWRRIHPGWIVPDENIGGVRLSSQAFQNQREQECLSIFFGDEILARGDSPDIVLGGHADYSLAAITSGLARDCKQGIVRKPTDEEEAHGLVFGPKPKTVKKKFASEATWIVGPR